MPFVNVFISKVVCRDRETIEGKDHFGIAGAAIVDGKPAVFVMPAQTITRNEQIQYTSNTLYNGYSSTLRIGLSVLAWDIDNNDKWAKARDDATKISDVVAAVVAKLPIPVVADVASAIIKNWPKVVDFFVDVDDNDELVRWSGYVDFPLPAPGQSGYTEFELKFSREDPVGFSSWDYSVFFGIIASNPQPFTDEPAGVRTLAPKTNTEQRHWLGRWESKNFHVTISRSPDDLALLKVHINPKNGIAAPTQEFGYVAAAEPINTAVLPPRVISRQQAMMLSIGKQRSVLLGDRTEWTVAIPQPGKPRTSGGDVIVLAGGALLEMFDVLVNGEPKNVYEIRYFRPAAPDSVAVLTMEEMLEKIVV
jgi:hypothetical protein